MLIPRVWLGQLWTDEDLDVSPHTVAAALADGNYSEAGLEVSSSHKMY